MIRVGILTFQNAINYGAVLQCYALQKKITDMNCNCEVINYINPYFKKRYSPFYVEYLNLKKFIYMILAFYYRRTRARKFARFLENHICLSPQYTSRNIKECIKRYDAVIVGSDQVWNLDISGNDKNYFLGFAKGIRRYSYAASFGDLEITENKSNDYRSLLENIEEISVREADGASIVHKLCNKKTIVNVDPVFLISEKDWLKIASDVNDTGYILVYKINASKCYDVAEKLSIQTRKKVKVILPDRSCPHNFEKYRTISPEEFVGFFKNADIVITDSFHGTLFSLIFEKIFYICPDEITNSNNSRLMNIIEKLNIHQQIIENIGQVDTNTLPNFTKIKMELSAERKKAEEYLEHIIDDTRLNMEKAE